MKRTGLGERIRAAREAAGLSVTAAAARLGVKQQQWNKWENEGVVPSPKYRHCIADTLEIDSDEFKDWVIAAVEQRDADKTQELVAARRDIAHLTSMLEQAIGELRRVTAVLSDETAERRSR